MGASGGSVVDIEQEGEVTHAQGKKGKSVYTEAGFWLEEDGSIHLAFRGVKGFHVAINADPRKRNGHPTLYKRLAHCLRQAGAPAPIDG
jgi:hypothetical protein